MTAKTVIATRPVKAKELAALFMDGARGELANNEDAVTEDATNEEAAWPELEAALANLLNELSLVQDEMLEVLAAKGNLFASGELSGIAVIREREASLEKRLQACHDQRRRLLAITAEQRWPADTLESVTLRLMPGPHDHLEAHLNEPGARRQLLQHGGLTRWVSAQCSMLHLSQLLEVLATGGR